MGLLEQLADTLGSERGRHAVVLGGVAHRTDRRARRRAERTLSSVQAFCCAECGTPAAQIQRAGTGAGSLGD